jgi:hypothetical protein
MIKGTKSSNYFKFFIFSVYIFSLAAFAQVFIPVSFWSSQSWTPRHLGSNLQAWYDASQISSVRTGTSGLLEAVSGDPVSEWRDLSGNNFHAAQSISGRQPTLNSTGWTGSLPTITWNGADNGLIISGWNSQKYSIALVIRHNDTSSVRAIITKRSSVGSGFFWFLYNSTSGTSNWDQNGSRYNTGFAPATSTDYIYVLVRPLTGSSREQYVNGILSGSTATNPDNLNTETLILGNDFSTSNRAINGYISELVIVNNNLSVAERQSLEGYLAWKWGTVSSLPSGHPYKSVKP